MRRTGIGFIGLVVLAASLLVAPSAAYAISESTVFGHADLVTKTQPLTVTMADFEPTQVLFATYRQVADPDHPPDADTACEPTMATNRDTRILDAATGSTSASKRIVIPLGLFVVCSYYTNPGKTAEADAMLLGIAIAGQWLTSPPPSAPRRTAVSLAPFRVRTTVTVVGAVTGPASGTVAIQRKVSRGYVTIARLPVRRSRYGGVVPAAKGQSLRAVLMAIPGTPAWAASRSPDVIVR